jgi:DNA-binding NarL/FixJ family response regulator
MIRLLLADDHQIVREGLKGILSAQPDLAVAGEAANGDEVMARVHAGEFDVLVLDISMPGRNGIEVIKLVRQERPGLPVLVLSMHQEDQYAVRALRAGAAGYLTKDSAGAELVSAIRKVAAGGRYITPAVAEQLALQIGRAEELPAHRLLSDREYEVFRLLAAGRSVTEIADQLALSVKTISTHKSRLMEKMRLGTQADLIRYAIEHQVVDPGT